MFAAWAGAMFGVCTKLFYNGLRKVPLRREPWDYIIFAGVGSLIGYEGSKFQKRQIEGLKSLSAELNRKDIYSDAKN